MKTWEYKIERGSYPANINCVNVIQKEEEELLNKLGKEGWEVFNIQKIQFNNLEGEGSGMHWKYYLKREINEQ